MTQDQEPKLVVGVGASAGGLEAFKLLLSALPADAGLALLLVQHLDPTHKSLLAELLAPSTKMVVRDADQGVELRANTVYIIRPDTALGVRSGRIELSQPTLHRGVRLPVDHLFRSLARDYGARSAGIVLTGAGSDGAAGVRAIKFAGGLTIAQDPEQSGQPGMPQASVDTGAIDLVLEIKDMPAALARFASLPPQARIEPAAQLQEDARDDGQPTSLADDDLGRLTALLEAQQGFDLRVYKTSTVERRVLRRMALSGLEAPDDYFKHLRENPAEQQQLVRDLLISVTEFFRDPKSFQALRETAIGPLVAEAAPGSTLRAWVPGCASGEEAYSIGIELLEAIEESGKRLELQIFATDIDQDALAVARAAIYPPSIQEQVSEPRLRKYFKPLDGRGYQVRSPLRDAISFAAHDLTKDPPFSRMHLVSCRNVLIYLTSEAQRYVLKILHFALESDGYLLLSTSESTGPQRELFSTVSKPDRIYKKVGASKPISVARSRHKPAPPRESETQGAAGRRGDSTDLARRALMQACTPPGIVVAEDGTLLYTHGEVEAYLRFPRDEGPRFDVSALLRPEIATRARGALYKCRRNHEPVTAYVSPEGAGGPRVRITARPAEGMGDGAVILTFEKLEERRDSADDREAVAPPEQEAVVEQLEKELQATREDLRNTVEELETSNEELRSSNEESMSMNEELQSANEELEATTEELRSLNEELTTVNGQLRDKVAQLERAHDDLQNFFASTKVATIFLDAELCIKRFTPAAQELLRIDLADTGRSITHMAREMLQHGLDEEARVVLEELSSRSREIHTKDGSWIARQVLPYRTENRRIEGVVVTFIDITDLKVATEQLALREEQQATISRLGLHALRELDLQGFMDRVVRDTQVTLDVDFCKILELQPGGSRLLLRAGAGWKQGLVGKVTEDGGLGSPAGYALQSQESLAVEDLSEEDRFSISPLLREHGVTSCLACNIRDSDYRYGVIGALTRERRAFTPEDANFLQAVANIVGSAIARYQSRMRLALELGVANVIAEAADLEETLGLILERMAKELASAIVAELWWTGDADTLYRRALHVAPPSELGRVNKHFSDERISRGEGLIGQVWEQGRAIWASNLGEPQSFVRMEAANALGLVSGIGLPLHVGGEVSGVIALFSSERLFADEVYLRSLESVGGSIGSFVSRWHSDQAVRELAAITESSHDAIVSYRYDGSVTRWLPGAERLYGYSEQEMVGDSIDRVVPEDRREELWSINARIRNGEVVDPYDTERVRKDGGLVGVSVRTSPVRDSEGRVIGISSTDRDITRQKEVERKLLDADRQKDEFLAMLGHELRNPVATIRSATDILNLSGDDSSEQAKRARSVLDRQVAHVTRLLDSLLDVSRIIRGKIKLQPEVLELDALYREFVADLAGRMTSQKRDIGIESSGGPFWVEGDRVRLVQVLDNLLSNALKFTKEGDSITVSLKREEDTVALMVRDTGIGIEPDLLPYLFDVFRQSNQALDRTRGGLGLGLALVKSLAELHDGSVEARSDGKDRGSEFVVRLPLTHKTAPARPSGEPSDKDRPRRILLIEDNEQAAEMLSTALELAGYEVAVANRGAEGVVMANELLPDVVLCDLGLPEGMSGFDVARQLRSGARTRAIPLVAITGYGRPEDKAAAAEAGFSEHLTKPVGIEALKRTLNGLTGSASNDSGPLSETQSER